MSLGIFTEKASIIFDFSINTISIITVSFPDNNDNFINNSNYIADTHKAMDTNNFEHTNFQQFLGVIELEALVYPSQALFTNTCHVEVTILRILTKLEAPLWAFKINMNWACDNSQTGYRIIPQQESYPFQLQIITKWVGMEEHMMPKVVEVPLPGVQPDDVVPVTKFDL
jgi:hypothetical protein